MEKEPTTQRSFVSAALITAACLCLIPALTPGSLRAEGVSLPVLKTTLPASWDEVWYSSPVVWDLDGDGANEIIAARHGVLYVWNAAGEHVWRAATGQNGTLDEVHGSDRQYAGPVVGDLDGKGKGEIAIGFGNKVAVYDHLGKLMAGWPQTFPGPAGEIRAIAAADLDNDGQMEIVVAKSGLGPTTMAYTLAGAPVPGWPQSKGCEKCNDHGGLNQNLGIADLDGDGKPEIVVSYDSSHIGIMHADGKPFAADTSFAAAGPWASSVPMFHDLALAQQGTGADSSDRDDFSHSPPVFADVDGDGKSEVILHSIHRKSGDTANYGNCLWVVHPDMTRAKGFEKPLCADAPIFTGSYNKILETAPVPALANLTGDARPEIVVPSNDGTIRGFSPDGVQLWKYKYDGLGEPWVQASEVVIGDLNQDGVPEIVFTTYSVDNFVSHITILDNNGRMQRKASLDKRGSMTAPTLADVDGDGKLDIVLSLKNVVGVGMGGVQVWTVASAGDNKPAWPTGRGGYLRTGRMSGTEIPTHFLRPVVRPMRSGRMGPWFDLLGVRAVAADKVRPRLLFTPAP
ncbi:MAG: FG-GAP-like repeat-containing protein [Fibrobacterota bacterium]|nr:FG-GAP-like repeat-containing protein [Fibrobacterota bacterium]